jgi:hypothetical protein
MAQQRPEVQTIPGWTGFDQALPRSDEKPTVVGPLPIENAPHMNLRLSGQSY